MVTLPKLSEFRIKSINVEIINECFYRENNEGECLRCFGCVVPVVCLCCFVSVVFVVYLPLDFTAR